MAAYSDQQLAVTDKAPRCRRTTTTKKAKGDGQPPAGPAPSESELPSNPPPVPLLEAKGTSCKRKPPAPRPIGKFQATGGVASEGSSDSKQAKRR